MIAVEGATEAITWLVRLDLRVANYAALLSGAMSRPWMPAVETTSYGPAEDPR